jgi:ATP-dependent DNA helicase RecG
MRLPCKPDTIGEYLSALSNGACYKRQPYGYLVFGIEDGTHQLTGTDFKPHIEKANGQELENWLACHLTPRIDFNIYSFRCLALDFVIFKIQCTRSIPVTFKGESYIRIGSYKKKLGDHPERAKVIWSRENYFVYEKEAGMHDVSADSVLHYIDYPSFFDLLNIPLPDNKKGIIAKFIEEKIIYDKDGKYDITNLGALLFAKEITNFEELSRKALRVVFYDGKNRIKTIKEQIGKKGYAVGFDGLIKYLEDQLPSNEVMGRALRGKVSAYPILAIRELVANALIHQDFGIKGISPMVEIFSNRIEITNPGKPLIDPLRFVDHSPESRNETMAGFMRRVNICEERGSGIDKVIWECEYNQLPAPEIIVGDNYTRIILYGLQAVKEMDKRDKIRSCYLHACLKYVSSEHMTNQSLRDRFGIAEKNYPMVSRIISDTIAEGLIKDYDPENRSRKYAKYIPFWA